MPSADSNTAEASVAARTTPCEYVDLPVLRLVRTSVSVLPTDDRSSVAGVNSAASRFFSRTAPGSPVTIAVAASIPSATPSKLSLLSPAGRSTRRCSLRSAKPPRESSRMPPDSRAGDRYTVTATASGDAAVTSAAYAPPVAASNASASAACVNGACRDTDHPALVPADERGGNVCRAVGRYVDDPFCDRRIGP